MKALSLWQPHVAAIALGLKTWETRDWPTSYRGRLALHAAKRPWSDADEWHQLARVRMGLQVAAVVLERFPEHDVERQKQIGQSVLDRLLVFGAVVCTAEIVDCVPTHRLRGQIPPEVEFWGDFSDGEEGRGRYAFRLENMQILSRPIAWRGMQGFFDVPIGGDVPIAGPPVASGQLDLFGGVL